MTHVNDTCSRLPSLSIVTPAYNSERYIRETVDSLIRQNYPKLEYVVTDGGSSDATVTIVQSFGSVVSRLVSEKDNGPVDALEKGRGLTSGTIFNWLNSDDILLPGTLMTLGCIAADYPDWDVYAFLGMERWGDGILTSRAGHWPSYWVVQVLCGVSVFAQESTFLRASFLNDHGIHLRREYRNVFDTLLYEEMLLEGARVLLIEAYGGAIRHHPQSLTASGIPMSDYAQAKQWRAGAFPRRQLFGRRVTGSRVGRPLSKLWEYRASRSKIARLLGKQRSDLAVCRRVGVDAAAPGAWRVEYLW